MKNVVFAIVSTAVVGLAACGGNVVVDTPNTTSPDGGGAGGGMTTQTGTGASSCFGAPKPGVLTLCGGSGSSGGAVCSFLYCGQGDGWLANCKGDSCECLHDGMELCTCAVKGSGDICSGTPDCCFN
jgi:hypothetical protein